MRGRRRATAVGAVAVVAGLTACAPALPESVVPGSEVVIGWDAEFTSANAAADPTPGNVDISEAIRADFGDIIDGDFVADEAFGTVEILDDDPFTVRYDLTEPVWSDSIPLDAADLVLGWAGASGYFAQGDEDPGATSAPPPPRIDEFDRAIEVTFPEPVMSWQRAVSAPVPAHIVGAAAFGLDDPMEAKQAVIAAILDGDAAAIASLSTVWHEHFEIGGAQPDAAALLSSGPFLVGEVEDAGRTVTLVPNPAYRGLKTAQVARIDLVPQGDDPLSAIGDTLDVVRVSPTAENRAAIRELERTDHMVDISHDGTMWALLLNPTGVFTDHASRTAFLHATSARAISDAGAGEWTSAYISTTSMVSAPGSRTYDIVNEDSGFTKTLGTPGDDPALEREASGQPGGTSVCVLYDRASAYATGAFGALKSTAAESGWNVTDCGSDDFGAALEQRGWNAVIARVPVPASPEEIADQWGSAGAASIVRDATTERDELIAELARTTDVYEARDVTARIEASIVRSAVALPIAVNPQLTIADRGVAGVSPRSGADATLTHALTQWSVVR